MFYGLKIKNWLIPPFTREGPWQNGIDFLEAKSLLAYFKARKIGQSRGLALDLGDLFNNPTAYPASALFLFLYFYGRDYPEVDPKEICEII